MWHDPGKESSITCRGAAPLDAFPIGYGFGDVTVVEHGNRSKNANRGAVSPCRRVVESRARG